MGEPKSGPAIAPQVILAAPERSARKRIADAQRKRWAKVKKNRRPGGPPAGG